MEEHLSARLPAAFIPTHMLQATGKSALISGHFATIPAIAKLLISQEPPWPALFRREQATYHIFQERTPPVHVPQMLYADEQQNVLITTAVQGAIISQDRYPHDISASCAQYLIESAQAIHQWETDQAISPLFNYTERIHKYEGYGWFSGPMATKLLSYLSILVVPWAFAHGDFLVSNCIINEQGITMIDWEFAGSYLPGYDLALLWTCFEESPHARQVIDSAITSLGSQSWHMACAIEINRMLIVARELKEHALLPSSGKQSRRMSLLQRDFAYVWKRIEGMQW